MSKRDPKELITYALAIVIIGAWSVSFLRTHADTGYSMPGWLTPLMSSVVAWCFVGDVARKLRGSDDDDDKE